MSKRLPFFLTIFIFIPIFSFCQVTKTLDGAYRTANDFLNNSPSFINQFNIIKREEWKISDFGGSLYKVVSKDKKKLDKQYIKYGLWGVVVENTLFINNSKYSLNPGYNKITFLGDNFVLFIGNIVVEDETRTTNWANSREKLDFILRYRRGVAYSFAKEKYFILNDIVMDWLIKDYPVLIDEFNQLLDSEYKDDYTEITKRFEIIKKLDILIQANK